MTRVGRRGRPEILLRLNIEAGTLTLMSEKPTQFDRQAIDAYDSWLEKHLLSRRRAIGLAALTVGAFASPTILAQPPKSKFSKVLEDEVARDYTGVHEGKGTISVRYFPFDNYPSPAHFVIYDIPPGASEGVHTHHLGDTVLGPYDEYYYIIAGQGEMQIDGTVVPVKAGDHVHTPLSVAHGISNIMSKESLKVYLTFITREG